MLVITRRPNESIRIDTGSEVINIVIVHIRSNKVRIGVDADKHVRIIREEVANES
jgi:carbon storage regulator CsrA